MRHLRLTGVLLLIVAAIALAPVTSANPLSPDDIAPTCADGCPAGPRPTAY